MSNRLADMLHTLKVTKGMNQEEVAEMIGYSRAHLSVAKKDGNLSIERALEKLFPELFTTVTISSTKPISNGHTEKDKEIEQLKLKLAMLEGQLKEAKDLIRTLLEKR